MSIDYFLPGELFLRQTESDPGIEKKMHELADRMKANGVDINPLILDYFKNPDLFNALPDTIRNSDEALIELLEHSGRFEDCITRERKKRWNADTSGLFGEDVHIGETSHADGRTRRAESGYKIHVDYLRTLGIDPTKVLFFRITQPSDEPKPELYWTSDYFETKRGLQVEIPAEQRKTAVILVADLETINQNGGLIQDINDDQGLAVRQIGTGTFDQKLALTKIKPVNV